MRTRRLYSVAKCLGAASTILLFADSVRAAPTMRPCWRNLTPEAQNRLAEYRQLGKDWRGHVDHTKLLVRGQFFYGLEKTYYIHNFYERPLMQDSSISAQNEHGHMLNPEGWRRTVQVARDMNLDGFAFFPTNPGCWDLLPRSTMSGSEIPILAEFHSGDRALGVQHCAEVAGRILSSPNAFKVGGKVVMTCYPAASWTDNAALDIWPDVKRELEKRYGKDKFALMPYMRVFDYSDLDGGVMTDAILERTREHLREILRKTDGIFYWLSESSWASPEVLRRPHDEIVVPLVKSVLAEPEFREKFYGIGYWQAHENCYRCYHDTASLGLIRLVTALESIAKCGPDFAIGFEWDEENENTHFRPTVSNGFTTQRIMRHFSDVIGGRAPFLYPGDEGVTNVPNLVIAYQKSVQAGDSLEAQVLNIPDGTQSLEPWGVSVVWKDANGVVVKGFDEQPLDSSGCKMVRFRVPAVDLICHHVLYPELRVRTANGMARTFSDGLWPVNLEANRNPDCKWVRMSLREVAQGVKGNIEVGPARADGSRIVRGRVSGLEDFRSVEVLEGPDTVYFYDPKNSDRLDDDRIRVRIGLFALRSFWKNHSATGSIAVSHAPTARLSESNPSYADRRANVWRLNQKVKSLNFLNTHFVDIAREDANDAVILFELPDVFPQLKVRVSEIVEKDMLSFAGPAGAQITLSRERTQLGMPPPCGGKTAEFSFVVKPRNPLSVFRLQTIDRDYRVWRSKAVSIFRPVGKDVSFPVYDVTEGIRQSVTVDAGRIVSVAYRFDHGNADAYFSGRWRDLPLVSGGGCGLLTWLGCGESKEYGNAFGVIRPNLSALPGGERTRAAPCREPDGTVSLSFDGCSFANVWHQVIPRYAGFELRMKIMPLGMEGVEGLLDASQLGFKLWLEKGVPKAFFALGNEISRLGINETQGPMVTGLQLRKGEWNELVVRMNQCQAWIEVNGRAGERRPCVGYQCNGGVLLVGVKSDALAFFKGRIAALDVRPWGEGEDRP